jgi:hypothetical protein
MLLHLSSNSGILIFTWAKNNKDQRYVIAAACTTYLENAIVILMRIILLKVIALLRNKSHKETQAAHDSEKTLELRGGYVKNNCLEYKKY